MGILALKVMYTALVFLFFSVGVMKLNEIDEMPTLVIVANVMLFFISGATAFVSALIAIWV